MKPLRPVAAALLVCSVLRAAPGAQAANTGLASFDEVWQIVADTFYDPTFGGLDWNRVRTELRPRAEAAATPDEARRVINDLLARLERSHFTLLSSSAVDDGAPLGPAMVPIDIRVLPEGVLITKVANASAAAAGGLAPGQWLRAIDGRNVGRGVPATSDASARTSRYQTWRQVFRALHGEPGSTAALEVQTAQGQTRHIPAARVLDSGQIVALGNLPPLVVRTDIREVTSPGGHRAGFIGFNIWLTAIAEPLAAAVDRFRSADAIVIDLRGNPGGLAAMMSGIAGHFLADPAALIGRMQTRQGVLEFHPNPRLSTADGRRVVPYAGPVAILVDDLTASASECFAGGLQSLGRVRVFGRLTMGQALPALTSRLPNGDVLIHAIGDFVTSTGRSLEGNGVVPDEPVALSAATLADGRDPDLLAALAWVDRLRP